MKNLTRREAIGAIVAGSVAVTLAGLEDIRKASAYEKGENVMTSEQQANPTQPARAFVGQHQAKPLPFDPAKLKGISEKLIKSHWENNYSGAVKALNAVEQRLDVMLKEKDLPAYIYGDLKREELIRTGSVILHENYFANLGGDGKASGKARDLLIQWFGSYEQWETEFKKTAAALGGGSGWVVLSYNLYTGEVHNYWAWDHMHNAPMGWPLLVLDMYEHAYQMDYGAAALQYIDAFMQNVNWDEVNRRLEAGMKANLA
jgi:superoxide dismutase, Fe-Mn family